MSSKLVRDTMTAAWPALVPTVPLVPVANTEPKGMTSPWAALDFTAFSNERDSVGTTPCWIEEGEVFVNVFVDSGGGDAALVTACDLIQKSWQKWSHSTIDLKVISALPLEESPISTGLWYSAIVSLRYEYRYIY